ncbi:MAG: hypothetical protein ABIJ39_00885 [Chloroflexota bacterium]
MLLDDKKIVLRVVERYARTGTASDDEFKVTCLPDNKTSFVEQTGEDSRSILLKEYRVDGKVFWAGFSRRSGIVYLSAVSSR